MAARRMEIRRSLLWLCLYLAVCLGAAGLAADGADAAQLVSPGKDCTLSVYCRHGGVDVSGVPVQLFRVADVTETYQFTLTSAFQASGLALNEIKSSAEWNGVRSTLQAYLLTQNVEAVETTVTGRDGGARFEGLKPGLYFAKVGSAARSDRIYSFEPALVSLSGTVEVTCKSQVVPMPKPDNPGDDPKPGEAPLQFKVLKLWKGDSGLDTRPEEVEIEIFCNGESYQTAVLSETNHWSYSWTAKADGSDWTVAERNIPEGYVLTVIDKGTSFVLTNTLTPENPEDSGDPELDLPDIPDEPDPPLSDRPKTGDTSNVLLYTILLYGSGCALILLGIIRKRKKL